MKLIDILVAAGDETPLFGMHTKYLAMDPDGRVHGYCEMPSPAVLGWGIPDALYSTDGRVCLIQIDRDDVDGQWQSAIITREQYEAALASKNEGWIDWGGGKFPPVSAETIVDVKFKKGYVQSGYPAGEYLWEHAWQGSNIIAYRLHKPQEVTEADDEADLNECIVQDAALVWGGEGKPAIGEKCEHHSGDQWAVVTIAGIYENLVTGFTDYWMVKEDGRSYTVGNPYRFRPIRSESERKRYEAVQALCDAGGGFGRVDEKSEHDKSWFDIYDAIAAGKVRGVKLED